MIISVVASLILAYVNQVSEPMIKANQQKQEDEARAKVLPEATEFFEDSLAIEKGNNAEIPNPLKRKKAEGNAMFKFFVGKDAAGDTVGYTFIASKYGYSGDVKTMVGLTPELKIKQIQIITQTETPGLGANCTKSDFAPKFVDRTKDNLIVDKDGGDIVSMTGATITTRTIANSIKEGLENLSKALGKGEVQCH